MPNRQIKILQEYIGNWLPSNYIASIGIGYIVGSKKIYDFTTTKILEMPAGTTAEKQMCNYGGGIMGVGMSFITVNILTIVPILISRAIVERGMGYSKEESKRIANKLNAIIAAPIYAAATYFSTELIVRDTDKLSPAEKELLEYCLPIITAAITFAFAAALPKAKEAMRSYAPKWLNDLLCSPHDGPLESEQPDATHSINSQEEIPSDRLLQPTAYQPQSIEQYGSMTT